MKQKSSQTAYHHSDYLATTAQMPHCKKLHEWILRVITAALLIPLNVYIIAQNTADQAKRISAYISGVSLIRELILTISPGGSDRFTASWF